MTISIHRHAIAGFALAVLLLAASVRPADARQDRSFHMGFTPLPVDSEFGRGIVYSYMNVGSNLVSHTGLFRVDGSIMPAGIAWFDRLRRPLGSQGLLP